jgi:hypothetical protein
MAYYTALVAKWATLAPDTTANKLAAINALTVAGPNGDVQVSSVNRSCRIDRIHPGRA